MSEITVVIPTYNRASLIRDAIESALNQTCSDVDILVVDDGSRDGTREVVEPYIASGAIRYLRQDNKGVSAARNTGIREATGRFVAFLDSDDMWTPEHLGQLHAALTRFPEADVAFSQFRFMGDGADADAQNAAFGASIRQFLPRAFSRQDDDRWLSQDGLLLAMLEVGFPFRIQGSLTRRDFLARHDLRFDEGISFTEEAQFMLEAAPLTRFVFVERVGVLVRRHEENAGDVGYGQKRIDSYERRVTRMKERIGGRVSGAERRAYYRSLGDMQAVVMRARVENGGVIARLVEPFRLLVAVPTFQSVKRAVKALFGSTSTG